MESSYYLNIKEKYESFKGNLVNFRNQVDDSSIDFKEVAEYIKDLVIDKELIDKGIISSIAISFSEYVGSLSTVIDECEQKIIEYDSLYKQALDNERLESLNVQSEEPLSDIEN